MDNDKAHFFDGLGVWGLPDGGIRSTVRQTTSVSRKNDGHIRPVRNLILLLILCLAGGAWGASHTYYINGDSGNDTTGNGTSGLPWATIGKAINLATDDRGDGDTITIKIVPKAGSIAYNEWWNFNNDAVHNAINFVLEPATTGETWYATTSNGYYWIQVGTVPTSGSITVRNCSLTDGTDMALITMSANYGMDIILEDCVISNGNSNTSTGIYRSVANTSGTPSRDVTFTRCVLSCTQTTSASAIALYDVGTVTLTGTTVTCAGNNALSVEDDTTILWLDDCVITTTKAVYAAINYGGGKNVGRVEVKNSIITNPSIDYATHFDSILL